MSYLPRSIEESVRRSLAQFPCVYINGPRQSGKTTLAKIIWKEAFYLNFDNIALLNLARSSPQGFLSAYESKLILDEIQLVPELYRTIKYIIDDKRSKSSEKVRELYLLTGSTNILALPKLSDALVGRMIIKTLYPFSTREVYQEKGSFLKKLREGDFKLGKVKAYNLVEAIQLASFPELKNTNSEFKYDWFRSYLATLLQRDVQYIADIEKISLLPQLLHLLGTRVGNILNEADLARSVKENAVTLKRYRTILDLLFLTITLPPWFKNLGKRLIKAPKIYLMDTNMICYLLGRNLDQVRILDLNLFGHLLENFVCTELLKEISDPLHQSGLYHFRTLEGKEVDFVVEFPDQKIVGIEVKASEIITKKDYSGLIELEKLTGENFSQGCVLYQGNQILKITPKIWALPFSCLWS